MRIVYKHFVDHIIVVDYQERTAPLPKATITHVTQ